MRKIYLCVLMALSILLITMACSLSQLGHSKGDIAHTLGVDLSSATILQNIDSHGGFFGEGDTYVEMEFADNEGKVFVEKLENNGLWSKLPLTENLNIAVYGEKDESEWVGSLAVNDNGEAYFPLVDNGYYFFLDRHSESTDSRDDTDLLNRDSYNFIIAIYDTDNHRLHYYKLDT